MRRICIIFLCCIFFSYDSVLFAAKNTQDVKSELDGIFFRALEIDQIVDNSVSEDSSGERISSDEFFKDWHVLEYCEFLRILNELFKLKDSIPSNFIKRKIYSTLLEIFGGIYLQQSIQQNDDDWYISESTLDRVDFLLTYSQNNLSRHDGAVLTIDEESVTVKKILEVKTRTKLYDPEQSKKVLYRWITEGINVANIVFTSSNISNIQKLQIYLDELNQDKDVSKINSAHDNLIEIYTFTTLDRYYLQKKSVSARDILKIISESICDKFFEPNFDAVLDSMNNQFINLLVNLYAAYMQLTNKRVPSISRHVITSSVGNLRKKYCAEHIKSFVVAFLSVSENDVLWNYFTNIMKKIFDEQEELDTITEDMSKNGYTVSEPENIKQQIEKKLVELLGEDNEDIIHDVVSNAQYYVSTHDPVKDLQHKYDVLLEYFTEKQNEADRLSNNSEKSSHLSPEEIVRTIMLSNLDSFLSTTFVEYKVYLLNNLKLSIEESYTILIKYFDTLYYVGSIDDNYINFIRRIYPQRGEEVSVFEVISFMLENNFEYIVKDEAIYFYGAEIWELINKLEAEAENESSNDSNEQKIYNLFHQYFTEHPVGSESAKDVVRRIILASPYSIMKNLVIVRLENFLKQLSNLNLSGEESYEIMMRYIDFDSIGLNNLDISQDKIDIVRETNPKLESNFEVLRFIFDNKLEYMSAEDTLDILCLDIEDNSIDRLKNRNIKQNIYYLMEYLSKCFEKDLPLLTLQVQEILDKRPLIFINTSSHLVKIFLNILSGLTLSLEESITIIIKYFDLDKLSFANISREKIDFIRNQDSELKSKSDFEILVHIYYENESNTLETANQYWIPLAMILSKYFKKHPIGDPNIQIGNIIGSHFSNFMRINPEELNHFLSQLDSLNISGEEAYKIMTDYFDFNPGIIGKLDISKAKIDCLRRYYNSSYNYSDFALLCFIFDNEPLICMNPSQVETFFHDHNNILFQVQENSLIVSRNYGIVPKFIKKHDEPNDSIFHNNFCIKYFTQTPPSGDSTSKDDQ